jgi:hypothetical protein
LGKRQEVNLPKQIKTAAMISVALYLMLLPTNAEQGGLNAGELFQLYNDPKSKEYVAKIVQATGRGFSLANTAIARRGQSPLYCQPNNLVLTGEQIIDIIYRFVEINPALEKAVWEAVMLKALENLFPCR